jgi:hypothetical protein
MRKNYATITLDTQEIRMIELAIHEPKIEQFFNHSKDEMLRALRYIVQNNITDFDTPTSSSLSEKQKSELNKRIASFHQNPSIGRSWDEIKKEL